jgi:membrane-anchored protein YejM (alkaline phosphatase superfamily)
MPRLLPVHALLLACALALSACGGTPSGTRAGVVLIVIDTLRADVVLDDGSPHRAATPRIDALAAEGASFASAFSHAPMTLPAHTSLFSSRFPYETGVRINGQPVPEDVPLLAEHLAERGYDTRAVYSLGTLVPHRGPGSSLDRGFDHWEHAPGAVSRAQDVVATLRPLVEDLEPDEPFLLFAHFADPHNPYNAHGTVAATAEIVLDGEVLDTVVTSESPRWSRTLELAPGAHELVVRSTERLSVRSLRFTRDGEAAPVEFREGALRKRVERLRVELENAASGTAEHELVLWVTDVPSKGEIPGRYVREVEHADRYVGELLDLLRARDLYDGSWVILTSDHGEALGERGLVGHVQNLHDELIRVPLIVKPPLERAGDLERLRAAGAGLVRHVDLVPTLLEGLELEPLAGARGRSLLTLAATGGPDPHLAETHEPEAKRTQLALRDRARKLVLFPAEDRFELYDLAADPAEERDRGGEEDDERRAWYALLRTIAGAGGAGLPSTDSIDPATLEEMRALGYFGDG